MSARQADDSPGHFAWIVEGRSPNQRSTLKLYRIIHDGERKLNGNVELQEASQELTGIAFSLWRSVFLSDTTGEFTDTLADVKKFLVSLISDNTVLYITDKNSRNWSFHYYLRNAMYRLHELSNGGLGLVDKAELAKPADSDKDEWLGAQIILDEAIERFAAALRGEPW